MKASGKGRENRDGIGVTDLTLKDMSDGKVLALACILHQGALTVLEKEVASAIIRALRASGHEHLAQITGGDQTAF